MRKLLMLPPLVLGCACLGLLFRGIIVNTVIGEVDFHELLVVELFEYPSVLDDVKLLGDELVYFLNDVFHFS